MSLPGRKIFVSLVQTLINERTKAINVFLNIEPLFFKNENSIGKSKCSFTDSSHFRIQSSFGIHRINKIPERLLVMWE